MFNSIFGGGNILGLAMNVLGMVFPALQMFNALFNMLNQAVGQAIQQGLQQLLQQGLPKFIGEALGQAAQQIFGGNRKDAGGAEAAAQEEYGSSMQELTNRLASQFVQDTLNAKDEDAEAKNSANSSAGSWLRALAKAFGKLADAAAKELDQKGKNINKDNPSDMIEYQALAQEFSLMMTTFTNAIKTLGEAMTSTTRKSG